MLGVNSQEGGVTGHRVRTQGKKFQPLGTGTERGVVSGGAGQKVSGNSPRTPPGGRGQDRSHSLVLNFIFKPRRVS